MRRPKPQQVIITIGVLAALGTIFSGIAPRVTKWEDDSSVARRVFVDIPDPLYWLFYTTAATMLLVSAWLVSQRVRNYERGAADDRRTTKDNAHRRMKDFRSGVWMRTLLRDPVAGVMHSFIYFGFLVLLAATIILEIDHQLPESLKFLHGTGLQGATRPSPTSFGVIFLSASCWAIARRYVQRPYRIRIKTKPEDAVVLGTFLVIGVTGFLTEGIRIALVGQPSFEKWSFVGYPLSNLFDGFSRPTSQNWHRALWGTHFAAFVAFLVLLPTTKLRHMVTSPMNMYLKRQGTAQGRDEAHAEPDGDRARDVRCLDHRGLHLEAAVRHRRLHGVRPLHLGLPGPRHRQAARPARDRAEGRRGDGRDRRPARLAAGGRRRDITHRRQLGVRRGSPPRSSGPAPPARRATRSARSTSRSSTRSSTCVATCRSWRATSRSSSATRTARWRTRPTSTA